MNFQTKAKAVFSDSGTISEELSILDFKVLNIRKVIIGHKQWGDITYHVGFREEIISQKVRSFANSRIRYIGDSWGKIVCKTCQIKY